MNPGAKWATFDWEDPFLIDDQLSEEEGMARDTARSYAQNLLQHRVVDAYRNESTDTAIFREMGELGIKCKQRLKMAAKALHNPSFAASFCVSTRVLVRPIGLDMVEVGGSNPPGPTKFLSICFYWILFLQNRAFWRFLRVDITAQK